MRKKDKKKCQNQQETPIADFLSSNARDLQANFHALPIYQMADNIEGFKNYKNLYGDKYLSLETTITGKIFDSFFYPCKQLKKAQKLAAEAFHAKDTLFITCGTTISNYIAVDALVNDSSSRVLMDRSAHQSMHFAVKNKNVKLDYFYNKNYCKLTDRQYIRLNSILDKVIEAKNNNVPYDLIIISATSYDGVVYNIYEIIKNILAIDQNIKFLIDEAWSCAFYFHPDMYKFTAGYASEMLGADVNIVSTQSAHKSLMALRQASIIHSFANDQITERLYKSRFKYHSTSPNYPILASIDLARAQMQKHGKNLLDQSILRKERLKNILSTDERYIEYRLDNRIGLSEISNGISVEDPLKVHLKIDHLNISGNDLQAYLYHNYGLYFNRYTNHSILLNIHIGINDNHINCLLEALEAIKKSNRSKKIMNFDEDGFIISYPPGIPLQTPGELIDHHRITIDINQKIKNGINVFQVK